MSVRLVVHVSLLIFPLVHGEVFQGRIKDGKADDSCPRHLRLCNDQCLEKTTNHTTPCDKGPWGKCLSAKFPFYCKITNTCIGKDEMCGDHCFDGNPDSFWYDHTSNDKTGKYDRKLNLWQLEEGAYDEIVSSGVFSQPVPKWLERYNCNGKCITYHDPCNGGCDHPEIIKKGGITKNLRSPIDLQKCGTECKRKSSMSGFHDCGNECLPQDVPCNGTCPHSTNWMTGPQWLCGNECRPKDQKSISFQRWKVCPDGTCRDNSINCDGPLPGNCPDGEILCKYHSWIRGSDFSCRSSSDNYYCNETREDNGWAQFWGAQKHPDEWCFRNSEPCQGECLPGYIKCGGKMKAPTCKDATEFIKCGDDCKESRYYHTCNGTCISTDEMCKGLCAVGFEKCGERCFLSSDSYFVDCDGKCQPSSELCNGECPKAGWFKALKVDISDGHKELLCEPISNKDDYYECNGNFLDSKLACNGTCLSKYASMCRGGKCLSPWNSVDCDGKCIDRVEQCNGVCKKDGMMPCGKLCKSNFQIEKGYYRTCGDECIYKDIMCDGKCSEGLAACGDKCIREDQMQWMQQCGDGCTSKRVPCEGKCTEDNPFKCLGDNGEMCLESKRVGDGRTDCQDESDEICFEQWSCNGKLQCINEPCHQHEQDLESDQTMCKSHVNKTYNVFGDVKRMAMFYCAAQDECKLEGIPCDGVCMANMEGTWKESKKHFACEDGTKCIQKFKVCDGRKDCDDGSDEICKCKGKINCQERLQVNGSSNHDIYFRCESGDEYTELRKYCDGKEDCKDGSDEICQDCPGIIKCWNGDLVCSNVPCNNLGMNDYDYDYPAAAERGDLTCENSGWDLCQTGPGEAKCVRRAERAIESKKRSRKAIYGELCNGQCLAGVQCGDKCIARYEGYESWSPSCNGLCDHINSSEPLVRCDGYCLTEEMIQSSRQSSSRFHKTLSCDGECRAHANTKQRMEASRRACNGSCLFGDRGNDQWFSCDTGDQCFSTEEWCNGVKDCLDGTDEASCSLCPKIKRCKAGNHPLVNQTSSNGPRFPDFVCNNEPCGECSYPGTFPCGSSCISTDQICSLSGLCSSPNQLKCDKCLDAEVICDGKEDCQDGSDEENCVDYRGSWICNGIIQTKTKPCI